MISITRKKFRERTAISTFSPSQVVIDFLTNDNYKFDTVKITPNRIFRNNCTVTSLFFPGMGFAEDCPFEDLSKNDFFFGSCPLAMRVVKHVARNWAVGVIVVRVRVTFV